MNHMEHRVGICGLCGGNCLIDAAVWDNTIQEVRKAQSHPFLPGHLCVRGAALKQFIHHKDRIQHPMKRVGPKGSGVYVPISWEQALAEIAKRLETSKQESGAQSTVFYAGHAKWYRKVLAELAAQYGTPNYCTESSTCFQASAMAWKLVFGGQFRADSMNSKTHVIWSSNPAAANGDMSFVEGLRRKGVKLIVADPRVTGTADAADLHLQLYPGTDGALALGIAHVILREGWEDREFIEKYTHGFDSYKTYVERFTPERVAEITGVPVEKIEEAARLMAGGRMSLSLIHI